MLFDILKLEVLDPYRIAFLDACCLQCVDNAGIYHGSLEVLHGIVVIEVSGTHGHLSPCTDYDECTAVITLNGELLVLLELIDLLILGDIVVKDNGRKLGNELRYLIRELLYTDTCSSAYHEYILEALALYFINEHLDLFLCSTVALIGDYYLGTLGKLGIKLYQLIVDGIKVIDGIPAVSSRYVYYMDKEPGPLDMAEEIMT